MLSGSSLAKNRPLVLFIALFAAVIAVHLPALTLIPSVSHDEAAVNAAARSWVNSGSISLTLLADIGKTYKNRYYWHPPGHLVAMAAAYRIFGYSILVTRLESLFFGALATSLFFLVARNLTGSSRAGVIAALFLAGHPLWWWLCRSGRMDTTAVAFGLAAILIWQCQRHGVTSLWRAALAGLILGIAGLFHVLVLIWIPAILAADTWERRRILWRQGIVFAFAGVLPVATWIAAAFSMGDRPAWLEQFWRYQVLQRRAPMPFMERPWAELHRFLTQMELQALFAAAVLVGFVLAWRRIKPETWRWCFGGLIVSLAMVTFGMQKDTGAYPMYWYCWLALISASGWNSVLASPSKSGKKAWCWLLGAGLANALALHCFWAGVGIYQRAARDPRRVDAFFASHIPQGSVVVGPESIWYAVEGAGASLRIWVRPDPSRGEYYVTPVGQLKEAPKGYFLEATLTDAMPLILGRYFSNTSNGYDLWAPAHRH